MFEIDAASGCTLVVRQRAKAAVNEFLPAGILRKARPEMTGVRHQIRSCFRFKSDGVVHAHDDAFATTLELGDSPVKLLATETFREFPRIAENDRYAVANHRSGLFRHLAPIFVTQNERSLSCQLARTALTTSNPATARLLVVRRFIASNARRSLLSPHQRSDLPTNRTSEHCEIPTQLPCLIKIRIPPSYVLRAQAAHLAGGERRRKALPWNWNMSRGIPIREVRRVAFHRLRWRIEIRLQ